MTNTTASTPTTGATTARGFRPFRSIIAVVLAVLAAGLGVVASAGAAGAHGGHGAASAEARPERASALAGPTTTTGPIAKEYVAVDQQVVEPGIVAWGEPGLTIGRTDRGTIRPGGPAVLVGKGATINGADADCFVDFDDDLVLEYTIPNAAENTFMTNHWYQGCFDGSYYPAMAVEFMDYGHLHLGYEDDRVGPCSGDFDDWGRKADPAPSDPAAVGAWAVEPCVSDIDPVTEPRSGIANHLPGHRTRIFAYEGHTDTEYLPFQLHSLQVVRGNVEVCHLPPGPIVVANGGGSPWQCFQLGEGYWDLSSHVPSAIEVRVEFLDNGEIDNVAIDLL